MTAYLFSFFLPVAALNYGLFRQASFNTTAFYVMFYDMGAASTTATIVGKGSHTDFFRLKMRLCPLEGEGGRCNKMHSEGGIVHWYTAS